MKNKRDSKDPMPTADNTDWVGGGNTPYPAGAEKHNQAKAERVSVASRFDKDKPGPAQPTRQNGDGNTSVTGEMHNSAKAERVPASARW